MAGLLQKLMALDRRVFRSEAWWRPRDPSRTWPVLRLFLVFGLAWVVAGTGLAAWVTFGGPLRVLFYAVLLLGMGLGWLVPSVLLLFLLGPEPPSGGSRPNR